MTPRLPITSRLWLVLFRFTPGLLRAALEHERRLVEALGKQALAIDREHQIAVVEWHRALRRGAITQAADVNQRALDATRRHAIVTAKLHRLRPESER